MTHSPYTILLTNDDGIHSEGLKAAAEALSTLGEVIIAAPRHEYSGSGRSMPADSDGVILQTKWRIGGKTIAAYAVGGAPAQTVIHALYEILPEKPDLVVSGINYGENVGDCVTASGTIGAALQAASLGVRSLAVSVQISDWEKFWRDKKVDFSAAAHFTRYFARLLLQHHLPDDVDILKVDVPETATPHTPWQVVRQAKHPYYVPTIRRNGSLDSPARLGYKVTLRAEDVPPDTDVHTLLFQQLVAVTPLSLDLTSRVPLKAFEQILRGEKKV